MTETNPYPEDRLQRRRPRPGTVPGTIGYTPDRLENMPSRQVVNGQQMYWDATNTRYVPGFTPRYGGGGGIGGNFPKLQQQAQLQRETLALPYRQDVFGIRENQRLSRAQQAEGVGSFGLAGGPNAVSGGIEELALQRILDAFRAQQSGLGGQLAQREGQYQGEMLDIERQLADAISREALARAAKRAGYIANTTLAPPQQYFGSLGGGS
jgi:hypothetical protein